MTNRRSIRPARIPTNRCPKEAHECIKFVYYCRKNRIPVIKVGNEGAQTGAMANKGYRDLMGYTKGAFDYIIPVSSKHYNVLWVEMKRLKGSVVSEEQLLFRDASRLRGNWAEITKGCEAAVEILQRYLDDELFIAEKNPASQ